MLVVGMVPGGVAGSAGAQSVTDVDSVPSGAQDLGDITDWDGPSFTGATLDGTDDTVDYFEFSLSEPRLVGVGLRQLDFDADLFLEDSSGSVLASSEVAGTDNEWIKVGLVAGTYFARVVANEAGRNDYRLRLGSAAAPEGTEFLGGAGSLTAVGSDANDSEEGLQSLEQHATDDSGMDGGSAPDGAFDLGDVTTLGASGHVWDAVVKSGDLVDYYSFTLTAGRRVAVGLFSMESDADVFVERQELDSSLTVLASSSNVSNSKEMLNANLTAGTYYVRVEAQRGPRNTYELFVGTASLSADDPASDFATAATVAMGHCFEGQHGARIAPGWDIDWVRVDLVAGETYVLEVRGPDSGSGSLVDPELLGVYVDPDGTVHGAYDAAGRLHAKQGGQIGLNGVSRAEFDPSEPEYDAILAALVAEEPRRVYVDAHDLDDGTGTDAWLLFRAEASGPHYLKVVGQGGFRGTYTVAVAEAADAPAVCGNEPPRLESPATGATVDENTRPVWLLSVVDGDGQDAVVDVRLAGSSPAGFFELSGSLASGDLRLVTTAALDHEAGDTDSGVYEAELVMISGIGDRERTARQRWTVIAGDVDEPPTSVQGLRAAAISHITATLQWGASSCDSATTCPPIGYEIYRLDGTEWVLLDRVEALSYTAAGLERETTHQFRVDANNDEGTAAGAVLGVTTGELPPDCAGDITTACTVAVDAVVSESVAEAGDADWYAVTLGVARLYRFEVSGGGSDALEDPFVKLYDGTGAAVAVGGVDVEDAETTGDGTAEVDYRSGMTGEYFLEVAASDGVGTGDYALSVVDLTPASMSEGVNDLPESPFTPGRVEPDGGEVTGEVGTVGDVDWFAVDLGASRTYRVSVVGGTGAGGLADPAFRLLDDAGAELSPAVGGTAVTEFTPAVAGTYFVAVSEDGDDGTGAYTVLVQELDCAGDATTGCVVEVGGSKVGGIGDAGDVDWYRVAVLAATDYEISVVGGSGAGDLADPVVRVYDATGVTVVVQDSDADDDGTAVTEFTPAVAGTYFVAVFEDDNDATGVYTVMVVATNNPPKFLDPYATDLPLGERLDVSLMENTELALDIDVFDADEADAVSGYSIVGGADESLFEIDAGNDDALTMTVVPDFEMPVDSGTDNVYEVQLQATSGAGARQRTATVLVAVTVTDDDSEALGKSSPQVIDERLESVSVKWTTPQTTGPPITGYQILRRPLPNGEWSHLPEAAPSVLEGVVDGLDSGAAYEIAVEARSDEGESLSDSVTAYTDECAASAVGSCPLAVGSPVTARINIFNAGADADWFVVELEATTPYRIEVKGSEPADPGGTLADPALTVFDAGGVAVADAFDADGGEGQNSVLAFTAPQTGTYYVEVREDGDDATGSYTVAVSTDDTCGASTATACTAAVDGTAAGTAETGSDVDWYAVGLDPDVAYVLYVASRRENSDGLADPLLVGVFNAVGVLIGGTADSDSGAGQDSYKLFTPDTAATYYVAVGSDSGLGGDFTLFVSRQRPQNSVSEPTGGDLASHAGTTGHILVAGQSTGGFSDEFDRDLFGVWLEAGRVYRIGASGACSGDAALVGGTSTGLGISLVDHQLDASHGSAAVHLGAGVGTEFIASASGACPRPAMDVQVLESLLVYVLAADDGVAGAGTYTVSVSDVSAEVTVPDTAGRDAAGSTSTSGRARVGVAVTGVIDPSGDVDWFAIEFEAGTAYRIDVRGDSVTDNGGTLGDPYVSLLDSAGDPLSPAVFDNDSGADNNARILLYTPTAPGTFYIEVKDNAGGTGTYTVAVGVGDACAATVSTACTVEADSAAEGTIGEAGDVDWFKAGALAADVPYTLYVAPRGAAADDLEDPKLEGVYDSAGVLIAGTTDSDSGAEKDSYGVFTPDTADTFYVAVGRDSGAPGAFSLFVARREPAATVSEDPGSDVHGGAGTWAHLLVGDTATGDLSHVGDADAVGVRLAAGRVYRLEAWGACPQEPRLSGGTLANPSLSLNDAAGSTDHSQLAAVNPAQGFSGEGSAATCTPASVDVQALDTVLAYAQITTADAVAPTGTWTLSMTDISAHATIAEPPDGDTAADTATAARVAVGASVTGTIDPDGDEDWYAVELEAGAAYRVDVRGASATDNGGTLADPHMSLLDSAGADLSPAVSDDNSGVGDNARIGSFTPTVTGTFYIAVSDPDGTGTGTYTLLVTPGADCPTDIATTCEAAIGGAVDGVIHANDDQDWFKATLAQDTAYTLYVTPRGSRAADLEDPELVGVYDSSGDLIADTTDADSGLGAHSYTVFTPDAAGVYYVAVGRDTRGVGGFTLWMARQRPGATVAEPTGGDLAPHAGTIGHLLAAGQATGTIADDRDEDLYGMWLEAGRAYRIAARGACTTDGPLHGGTLTGFGLSLENAAGDTTRIGTAQRILVSSTSELLGVFPSDVAFTASVSQECETASLDVEMLQSAPLYLRVAPSPGESGTYTVSLEDITAQLTVSEPLGQDFHAATATAGRAGIGGSATGTIRSAGDTDWFAVHLEAGGRYQIDVLGDVEQAYGGTLADPEVTLLDVDGNPLSPEVSDDNNGYDNNASIRSYPAAASGIHYIVIESADGLRTGTYTVQVHNPPPMRPSVPTLVTVQKSGYRDLVVSWEPPDDTGGAEVAVYEVVWESTVDGYDDFEDLLRRRKVVAGRTSTTISGLLGRLPASGTVPEYQVRVRALNAAGRSPRTEPETETPLVAPTIVKNLDLEVISDSSINVTWDPPDDNGGLGVTSYVVEYKPIFYAWSQANTATTTDTSYLISNRSSGQIFDVRVTARNAVAGTEWATTETFLPSLPDTPTDLTLYSKHQAFTVSWQLAPTDSKPISNSVLRWRRLPSTSWRMKTVDSDSRRAYDLSRFGNGADFEFQVAAENDAGRSPWTSTVIAAPIHQPQAPQNLSIDADHKQSGTSPKLRVTWSHDQSDTGFTVRWRLSTTSDFDEDDTKSLNGSARSTTINVQNGKTYIVQVTRGSQFNNNLKTATVSGTNYHARDWLKDEFLPNYTDDYPWLSEIFERLPKLPINVVSGNTSYVNTVATDIDGWSLGNSQRVYLTENVFSNIPDDGYLSQVAIHELAHVYTLNWRFINEPMAVLHLQQRVVIGTACVKTVEYLAETVTYATTGSLSASYYHNCNGKWSQFRNSTLATSAESALAGEIPAWFAQTYEDSSGDMDMEQIWDDLTNKELDTQETGRDRDIRIWGFRNMFGGFCSHWEARNSRQKLNLTNPFNDNSDLFDDVTANPWRDGGCRSRQPRDVTVTPGVHSLEISWKKPLWTFEPTVDGYLVQWKLFNEPDYHSNRQIIVDGLTDTTTVTIDNLVGDRFYTVRISAIEVDRPGILHDEFGHQRYIESNFHRV